MWLYLITNQLYVAAIWIASFFSSKAKKAIQGRMDFFEKHPVSDQSYIWFHCSSLGEFEQGRPLIEKLKEHFPEKKILLSFFSPSGYEMRKNYNGADKVVYLPFDSSSNAKKFIHTFKIEKAIFIKYDVWPWYVKELQENKIPVYLVSSLFRKNQFYFKWYGSFYQKLLKKLDGIFVQNAESLEVATNHGFTNVHVAGDMRIDRVIAIKNNSTGIERIEEFLKGRKAIVCGSVYPAEIELIKSIVNHLLPDEKLIIAPHNTDAGTVTFFMQQIPNAISFEKWNESSASQVMVIDHIGSLSRIYKYASSVYVGGGFGRSIHNILEPAVYGVPVFFGPNFSRFPEARQFINSEIGFSDTDQPALADKIISSRQINPQKTRHNSEQWFFENSGATQLIFNSIFFYN